MSDLVQYNLTRRDLSSLNCVLLGIPVENDVEFGNFRNPTAINLSIKFNGELHQFKLSTRSNRRGLHC